MLRADPIFFRSLVKGTGVRRSTFAVEELPDQGPAGPAWGQAGAARRLVALRSCPEWLHLERVLPDGATTPLVFEAASERVAEGERRAHPGWLAVPPGRRLQLVAAVDTDHRFFPRAASELPPGPTLQNEAARVELELADGQRLEVALALAEVVLERPDFDGVVALDLGTTNSCVAWKSRRAGPEELARPARCAPEVPSFVWFQELRNRDRPRVAVGHEARLLALAHPGRPWAGVEGVKRLLGTDRTITVLDARGRTATYRPHEVASFLARALLERAEADALDGRRIRRVVATYPTMFSPRRRRALQDAVLLALRAMDEARVAPELVAPGERTPDVQARCDALVELRLDEADAASFRWVTGPLLEACLRFGREQSAELLAVDVGGGTIDVSLLRVAARRSAIERSTRIEASLLGITGEPAYGGDNVSLELFRLLKAKVAVAAARALVSEAQATSPRASETLDVFDRILAGTVLPAGAAAPTGGGLSDGDEDDLPVPPLDRRLAWARLVARHAEVIVRAASEGVLEHPLVAEGRDAFVEHLRDLLRAECAEQGRAFDAADADRIDDALERLVPTRWGRHAATDPVLERAAKVLFLELWREANDRLKPLLVARAEQAAEADAPAAPSGASFRVAARVQEPLERVARHTGVDPKVFSDEVEVTQVELERMIEPRLRRALEKARELHRNAADLAEPPREPLPEDRDPTPPLLSSSRSQRRPGSGSLRRARGRLTLLLTGNSSILPAVRRLLGEAFAGVDHELVWDARARKSAVAQGAVEERLLAHEFGAEGGGIHYEAVDILERLPFSIGLWGRYVGFRPIFGRGAREGDVALVSARENELLKRDVEELAVFADHHDGAPPRYLGALDLRRAGRPADPADLEVVPAAEPEPRSGRPAFQALFRLRRDWEVEMVDPERGVVHRFAADPPRVDPREDPFSGVH